MLYQAFLNYPFIFRCDNKTIETKVLFEIAYMQEPVLHKERRRALTNFWVRDLELALQMSK